jgi:hypothetical protein
MALEWFSTARAASALGVSERTILRRAAAGKLESRKETTARGLVVVVALDTGEVPTGADIVPTGADTQTTLKAPEIASEVPTGADGADTTLTAHLLEENRFLRAMIEGLQQSEAVTKAALREALKAMPKALTSGTPETAPEPPVSGDKRGREGLGGAAAKGAQNATESGDEVDFDELESLINRVFK